MPRSFLARLRSTNPRSGEPGAAGPTGSTASGLIRRARLGRGTALRAGAGGALLLGVTAAVAGMTGMEAPQPARAAEFTAGPVVPTTDALGNPALRQQSLSLAAQAQARAAEARAQALKEAARSAERRAERAAAAAAAAAKRATVAEQARREAARKAAARAAAKAAAARAAKARSASSAPVRSGDPRSIARQLLAARGWSGQFGCLDRLFQRESNWNPRAMNPSSGAYGIPQSLPASKMASAGSDWRTNPATQIRWGLSYIAERYGTPCGAWAHSQSHGWY